VKRLAFLLVLAALAASCLPRFARSRRLTGTCEGACDHYLACKDAHTPAAEQSCVTECRQVFADEESLRAFESLSCRDAVEYVDGQPAAAAL
jgi:hypothetical protein